MFRLFVSLFLALIGSQVCAKDYPEFTGVYIHLKGNYVQAKPMPRTFSYLLPSTPPLEDQSLRAEFIYRDGKQYRVGGRKVSGRQALFFQTFDLQDYVNNAVVNWAFPADLDFSIVLVGRPGFQVTDRLNQLVRFDDIASSLKPLSAGQIAKCDEYKSRGMAPLAGGFDHCRAGEAGHDRAGKKLVDAGWGYNFRDLFSERIVNETTTEYVFTSKDDLCNDWKVPDLYGNGSLEMFGWVFVTNDGERYAFACRNHAPNVFDKKWLGEELYDQLLARKRKTCGGLGANPGC